MSEEYEMIFIPEEGRAIKNNKTGKIYYSEFQIIDEKDKQIKDLQQKVEQLEKENEQLQTQVNAYENPDDLTLFYMWLDEKAKDKIKQLKERCEYLERSNNRREDEIIELRDENVDLASKNNQLENIRKEAIDFVNENIKEDYYDTLDEYITHFIWNTEKDDLLNILNKGSEDNVKDKR